MRLALPDGAQVHPDYIEQQLGPDWHDHVLGEDETRQSIIKIWLAERLEQAAAQQTRG